MIDFPNAKINIGLFITGRRENGYHNVETVFYPVELCDALEFTESKKFSFNITGFEIPGNWEDNVAVKAFKILKSRFDLPDIAIHLHKKIPSGAGLGGGSADGAFMLKMLNVYFKLGLSVSQLKSYAGNLGADCPFFIENKPSFATGTGEVLNRVDLDLSGYTVVIIKPPFSVSTAEAYAGIKPDSPAVHLPEILRSKPEDWPGLIKNDFEKHLFTKYPELYHLKSLLYDLGAAFASMTGSGSAVYGIFGITPEGLNELFPENYFVYR